MTQAVHEVPPDKSKLSCQGYTIYLRNQKAIPIAMTFAMSDLCI